MAKLIILALAFTALVAFASAHKTVVTTTTIEDDENTYGRQTQQCRQIQDQSFNECEKYFKTQEMRTPIEKMGEKLQGQGLGERCCQELENVDSQCQCEAIKKVMRDSMSQQQQQQRGSFGGQSIQHLKQKAEKVMNKCNLQITPQQCRVGSIRTTTMITEDENPGFFPPRSQQQCRQMIPQRFNQCQRFIEKALQSGFPRIEMTTSRQGGQQQIQQLQQQCCNELENVQQMCHCEALEKVYEQAMQQQQQGMMSRQGGQQMQQVKQLVQSLKNQCNLQAQQCRIPSALF